MRGEIFFFATVNDMLEVLKKIEQERKIKYVKGGISDSPECEFYYTAEDIPNLGVNTSGEHGVSRFLILDYSIPVIMEKVKQNTGGVKYFINQSENKDSIVFRPSGFYSTGYLIHGQLDTISDSIVSKELQKQFKKAFTKSYTKVKRYYIGKEAMEFAGKVRFITMTVKQPIEYDLKFE
jgi:hypothetical protein